jgi:exosortase E/protease (VPEID-CTERM system)
MDSVPAGLVRGHRQLSVLRICWRSPSFLQRVLLLALLFIAELTVLSLWLDTASLSQSTGLLGIVGDWGAWVLRFVLGFAAIFGTFAWLKHKAAIERISSKVEQTPIRWGLLAAHCLALAAFVGLSSLVFVDGRSGRADLLGTSWFAAGISAIILGGLAFLPPATWAVLVRATGYLWAYALIAALSACVLGNMGGRWLWKAVTPARYLTFDLSKWFLSLFVSDIVANPQKMMLGTQRFSVNIAPGCSGLEGVGLILAFGVLWLLIFRRECRFPQSLVLLPFGVTLIFVLNATRIAALILIGSAGAQQAAASGFHSQAGWIAFDAVAVAFCFAIQRVPWFTSRPQKRLALARVTETPTGAFLLPFLAILTAGIVAKAFSGSFEWLYPLRFFAAAGMLWGCRRSYAGLTWRCDWLAPAIGTIVFVTWIGMDHFLNLNPGIDPRVPSTLLAPTLAKGIWVTFRVLAAVITVPLAEELAFRGYLMRRLISVNFNSVSFQSFSWFALLASSVTFGLLHGGNWLAGSVAGFLFGLAVVRRGRIGDAVVAHATANALLATYILILRS